MSEIVSRYQEIPLNVLIADFQEKALECAGSDVTKTNIVGAGFLLRNYAGLFNGAGPLRFDGVDRLPPNARDGLERVSDACLRVLQTAHEVGDKPIELSPLGAEYIEDGKPFYDIEKVISATQLGLEMVQEPETQAFREHLMENEFLILSGQVDLERVPLRRMYGPSDITKEAIRDMVLIAGEEFGNVMGGCEFLYPDENPKERSSVLEYIAGNLQSNWRHPDWHEPSRTEML